MKIISMLIVTLLLAISVASNVSAKQNPEPELNLNLIPEPCLEEGECEIIHDATINWQDLKDGILTNKMFINPTFSGKLTAVELRNVVFLNGRLGTIDLSDGAVLNGVVFRGNQITSLNFGGAKLYRVVLEGNLKQQPTYRTKEEQFPEPFLMNLQDAMVQDCIFMNNVVLINTNTNTVISKTSFTRNSMIGSDMQGAKIDNADISGNDARDSDLRFSSAADVKIVKNQVYGVKFPKNGKTRVAIRGNWTKNTVSEWERQRLISLADR
jgi:uncharacterized protein YjbI with pentapeptide repeats